MHMCERERMKELDLKSSDLFRSGEEIFSGFLPKLVGREIERIASSSSSF